jgi:hypothetical protein
MPAEAELAQLEQQLVGVRDLIDNAPVLRDVVAQVAGRLETADFEHKRLALDALKVKVLRDRVEIDGAVPFAKVGSGGATDTAQGRSGIGHHCTNMGITTWV